MITLSGYDIGERLHTGTRSTVFRAHRSADQQPVIIKIPTPEFPSREDLNRLRHEFSIGRAIDDCHVIHYDFGRASRLKQDIQQATSLYRLEGPVAYLSPEQTGRMNHTIDSRSDLYTLGVTLA
jgi:serine/threonine protein kinase